MNLDAIYEPTPQAAELLPSLRFPLMEWRVFHSLGTPQTSSARVATQSLGLPPEALAAILDRLIGAGLLHVPDFDYDEFKDRLPETRRITPEVSTATVTPEEQRTSVSFTLKKRTKPATPPSPALNLGSLVQVVREKSGGGSIGQLAVYRMFLKVPQETLQSAGLEQLDLDSTNLEITDPQLSRILREKACEVLNVQPQDLTSLLSS